MTFKTIILASVLSTSALTAVASENNKDYYVQLNTGASFGQKPKGDFSKGDLDTSALYGFALGYKFHENFRADWSLDYRPGFENDYTTSEVDDGITYTNTSDIKVKSLVSMVNFYYDIANVNGFTPYVTTGLGLSQNKTNNYVATTNSPNTNHTSVYSKKTMTEFAWKVGLGTKYEVNQNFDLDLRYQYADLGKFKTGSSDSENGGAYKDTKALQGSIKSHEALVGIAYKF